MSSLASDWPAQQYLFNQLGANMDNSVMSFDWLRAKSEIVISAW